MKAGSLDDLLKEWREAMKRLARAFDVMRKVLGRLNDELDEMETRLRQTVHSVNGTFERLKAEFNKEQK